MQDKKSISHMRVDYTKHVLDDHMVHEDPIEQFKNWFHEAVDAGVTEPNIMTLSTVNAAGKPSARIVLLKDIRTEGFTFFTNYGSHKGQDMEQNPHVALTFLWADHQRQVRIEGIAEKLEESESEAYFNSRPIESRIGAIISNQSQPLMSRDMLDETYNNMIESAKKGLQIIKPSQWGGYIVRPNRIEFWQGRPSRLHDRIEFYISDNQWKRQRLYP